ncbi:MAG: acyl-homoserine-lactone synthase [Pseudomonadota bacterium]
MIHIVNRNNRDFYADAVRAGFRLRKSIFIDRLKWPLQPDGEEERDQFDRADTTYLLKIDPATGQLQCMSRLLPTLGPTLMSEVFPHYCDDGVPVGPTIWEISRFCIAANVDKAVRSRCVGEMVLAYVEYGLLFGVEHFIFLAAPALLTHLIALGYDPEPLGLPKGEGTARSVALISQVRRGFLTRLRGKLELDHPVTQYIGDPRIFTPQVTLAA